MRQLTKKLNALGASFLVLAFLVMLPIGYLGKDIASPWCFVSGFLLAWIGFVLLTHCSGAVCSVGGGFLAACGIAVFAAGSGVLLAGNFLRDLLCASPMFAAAFWLRRRAAKAEVQASSSSSAPVQKSPFVVVRLVLLAGVGFATLMFGLMHARLLDSYPYVLGALVGASLGYILYRLVKRVGAAPYYALAFIAAPVGITASAIVNRYCDSSTSTDHPAEVLDFESRRRGADVCLVQSWRGTWSERITVSLVPCPVNGRIVVRTHAGALGWPWIESAWVIDSMPR